jgi:hypothetical protein
MKALLKEEVQSGDPFQILTELHLIKLEALYQFNLEGEN